jgi:hypothetical protein
MYIQQLDGHAIAAHSVGVVHASSVHVEESQRRLIAATPYY